MGQRTWMDRPVSWRSCFPLIILLPAGFLIQLLAASFPEWVEQYYSRGIYPILIGILNFFIGWIPFSVGEILTVGLLLWTLLGVACALRNVIKGKRSLGNTLIHAFANTLAALGMIYVTFLLLWGLNYQRKPLGNNLGFSTSHVEIPELKALCRELISKTNALRMGQVEDGQGVMLLSSRGKETLGRAFHGFDRIKKNYPILSTPAGNPKKSSIPILLSYLSTSGYYWPFTGEAHANLSIPDWGIPMTICHELAHQLGFPREDEANYLGYLACKMHPDSDFQYSGILSAMNYAMGALAKVDREAFDRLRTELNDAVRRDLKANRKFWAQYRSPIRKISSVGYDLYLKSQGQKEGIQSYSRMVDLLLAERRSRLR